MQIKIDPEVTKNFPQLRIGAVLIKGFNNNKRISATQQLLDGMCAQVRKSFTKEDLDKDERILVWREAYKKFGANPKKYPCSVEALMKRVVKGGDLPSINTLVDVYNYLSLKYVIPFGGEDLDKLCGDARLTYAEGNDPFVPLGGGKIEYVMKGEVIYRDDAGVTCRRWNYRECDRTKFTRDTQNACLLIEDLGVYGEEKLEEILKETQSFVEKYCGGEVSYEILSEKNSFIETGIEGQSGINDDPEESASPQMINDLMSNDQDKDGDDESDEENGKMEEVEEKVEEKIKKTTAFASTSATWDNKIREAVEKAVGNLYAEEEVEIEVEYPKDMAHGDYACNVALRLGKQLGRNPREVAEEVKEELGKVPGVEKVEVAGPGFLNFFLSNTTLNNEVNKILQKKSLYGRTDVGEGKTVVVEFSQPNVAKPLGIHHLLSTIIGQVITNLYKEVGYEAVTVNHIGDWGTQFGKLIYAYRTWGNKEDVEKRGIMALLDLYVKFHDEAEGNPELDDFGREEFRKLETGDQDNRKLWEWFVDITMKEVNPTLARLGVIFDYTIGESFYEDKMEDILEMGKEMGLFTVGDKGALVCEFENEKLPTCVIQKSDGASLYATRDLATVRYRVERWKPERLIYVVDVAQELYFKQFFEISRLLGITGGVELKHVKFGRMSLPDKSMSTRKGNVVLLEKVLDEAVERADAVIAEKSPDFSEEERREIAKKVGLGAMKYNVLSQNRNTNITFVWDKMLSFDGNSAPYLQYTTARAHSILRKFEDAGAGSEAGAEEAESADEVLLKRMFVKYAEVVLEAAKQYKPNILTNYLYELAKQFNAFYNNARVIGVGAATAERRVKVVQGAVQVLENGLRLLSIDPLEKM